MRGSCGLPLPHVGAQNNPIGLKHFPMAPNRGMVEVTRRDRLALVGELVNDVSHECNNQLAFVLSNLQNLAEYSDELAQIVAAYRERVKSAGLRDPELARLEDEMDLQFL